MWTSAGTCWVGASTCRVGALWLMWMQLHGALSSPSFMPFRCPSPCQDRLYPHYDSCQQYWNCTESCNATETTCNATQHFSYVRQRCVNNVPDRCNVFGFDCSVVAANCTNDTVVAITQVDILQVDQTACNGQCCGLHKGTCRANSHVEQTDIAKTACNGKPSCSVPVARLNFTNGCTSDAAYLRYRCIVVPEPLETTARPTTTQEPTTSPDHTTQSTDKAADSSSSVAPTSTASSLESTTGIAVGASVGVLILVAVAVVVVVVVVRKQRTHVSGNTPTATYVEDYEDVIVDTIGSQSEPVDRNDFPEASSNAAVATINDGVYEGLVIYANSMHDTQYARVVAPTSLPPHSSTGEQPRLY